MQLKNRIFVVVVVVCPVRRAYATEAAESQRNYVCETRKLDIWGVGLI